MKVLYLYSGKRKNKFKGDMHIDYPDTQFYGLNHLFKHDIDATFKEIDDLIKNKFLLKILSFRARHFLLYFLTRKYDIVFGSSILYMMILKKIFRSKTQFILLNIGLKRTLLSNVENIKSKIINLFVKELDGVVCLANVQKKFVLDRFPTLGNKVYYVSLGVDKEFYKPIFDNRKEYILSVGRDNGRDYKTVIDVAAKMPEQEFQIVCSQRNLEGIGNIPRNVKIYYDINIEELNRKYQEAKILLLITHDDKYSDASDCSGQTVLLDAMASGLSIIATKKEYLSDYLVDKEDALFVTPYDSDDIINKIIMLYNNAYALKIAKNSREKIERKFSTEKMAKNLALIFKKTI